MISTPTRGQAERSISQQIQALYRGQLEHQPSSITCQFLSATRFWSGGW